MAADKPIAWLADAWKTPPMSDEARRQAGFLVRQLQQGESVGMPHSRPMPSIGRRVHELRIKDEKAKATWRIFYRIDDDMIVVPEWFDKDTNRTPKRVINTCKQRLARYDEAKKRGG